jgi:hypothetical protein
MAVVSAAQGPKHGVQPRQHADWASRVHMQAAAASEQQIWLQGVGAAGTQPPTTTVTRRHAAACKACIHAERACVLFCSTICPVISTAGLNKCMPAELWTHAWLSSLPCITCVAPCSTCQTQYVFASRLHIYACATVLCCCMPALLHCLIICSWCQSTLQRLVCSSPAAHGPAVCCRA